MRARWRAAAELDACCNNWISVHRLALLIGIGFGFWLYRRIDQQVPRPVLLPDELINGPSLSPTLVQSLGLPLPPDLVPVYSLPDYFLETLKTVVDSLPRNSRTGPRQLVFTIFTLAHLRFALNLLCSQLAIRYDLSRHLYIALDQRAFDKMLSFQIPDDCPRPAIAFLDILGRGLGLPGLCRLKLLIHYTLLTMGVDVTSCDDDIVFYQDPFLLFDDDTDLQVGSEGGDRRFNLNFEYNKLNSGFFRVVPSDVSIHFYHYWARMAFANTSALGQTILAELVEPFRDKRFRGHPRQYYDMTTLLGRNQYLRITWFDPLAVTTAKLFHWERDETLTVARERGITRPFLFHAAWLQRHQKPIAFVENELWLVSLGRCELDKRLRNPWPGPDQTPVPIRGWQS
jgi:hypothetical protein